MSSAERSLIEKGFRTGLISILAATSTLAAGVNLPAGRVLVRSMNIGRDTLNVMQYKQMIGRAGRMGQGGNVGESFLLVKALEKTKALALSNQVMPNVVSQMHPGRDGGNALLKALLEVVGLGVCSTVTEAQLFVQQTLLFHQSITEQQSHQTTAATATTAVGVSVLELAESILSFMINARILDSEYKGATALVNFATDGAVKLKITKFGRAIMQSNVNPDEAIVMYDSLMRAQDALHLENSLHLLCLVTPLEHALMPNFKSLLGMYERSHNSKNRALANVFDAVGVGYAELSKWHCSPPSKGMMEMCSSAVKLHGIYVPCSSHSANRNASFRNIRTEDWRAMSRCKRLWAALALQGLLDGKPVQFLSKEFESDVSVIENVLSGAQIMSSKVVRFCEQIGWTAMERMIKDFHGALQLGKGDTKEMTNLMQIPHMTRKIAQVLSDNAMVQSPLGFAEAPTQSIAQLLQLSLGFELQVGYALSFA